MTTLKEQLHSLCLTAVQERLNSSDEAIRGARQAAQSETKSSAGDKYETGRAMAQLEIENHSVHRAETLKLLRILEQIDPRKKSDRVGPGSLVMTDQGNFYFAIPSGPFILQGKHYRAISPASPLGQKMMRLSVKDTFDFNGKYFTIQEIA